MRGLGLAARAVEGKLVVAVVAPEAKQLARIVDGRLVLVPEGKKLPKSEKCAKCDARATKRVLWAEGMAYQPACDEHVEQVSRELAAKNGGDVDGVRDIPAAKMRKPKFDESNHPRDRRGRFVEVGGTVSIFGGGSGTVLGSVGGGRIEVEKPDGTHVVLDAGQTTQIRTAEQNQGRANPASADPRDGGDDTAKPRQAPNTVTPRGPAADRADVPTGATPSPDADPAGAFQHLRTADGQQAAWLRTDEGDTPVGYLRPVADDPSTTVRFGDSQTWAEEVDARDMDSTDEVPASPTPADTAPGAAPVAEPNPAVSPDAPAAGDAPVLAPSTAIRTPTTASPQQVALFLEQGLGDQGPDPAPDDQPAGLTGTALRENEAAKAQAKRQVVADLTDRMREIPDEAVLRPEVLDELRALEDGSQVRLRKPDSEDRQIDADQWAKLRTANRDELSGAGVEVVSADQFRREQRENAVSSAVGLWATTSNGTNPRALALQEVAADLFGMEGHADWHEFSDNPTLREQVDTYKTDDREFMEAFLLAQYEATQDRLREAGITEVEVFRGHRVYDDDTPEWALDATTTDLPLRPLSSFSTDPEVAGRFARSSDTDEAYVLSGTVPAERVLATPRSGVGSLAEAEFVLLSGPGEWNVRAADETDGPVSSGDYWSGAGDPDDDVFYDDEDGEDYEFDPATEPAGFLSGDELLQAIAVADTPERRQALMNRAAVLRMNDAIPSAWNSDGSADDPSDGAGEALPPMTDDEYASHTAAVEDAVSRANAAGLSSERTHSLDGKGQVWNEERRALHREIVDDVLASGAQVPTEGRALIVGGPVGAPRLVEAKADRTKYLTISADDLKALLAAKGAVPDVPDGDDVVAPMERTALVDEEATYLANLIGQRAATERRNVAWELSMDDAGAVERRASALRTEGYTVDAEFVDVPVEASERRAAAAHRTATDAFRSGEGDGGRYVPPAIIREKADPEWGTLHRKTFEGMRDTFDDWTVYDGSADEGPPRRVYGKGDPDLDQRTAAEKMRWHKPEEKSLPGTAAALAKAKGGRR